MVYETLLVSQNYEYYCDAEIWTLWSPNLMYNSPTEYARKYYGLQKVEHIQTAHFLPQDMVHTLYKFVLYSQNVIRFYGRRVNVL